MTRNVLFYLIDSAAKFPEKTALADANRSISYNALWQQVQRGGSFLQRALKGRRNQPVFVTIGRNVESVIAFYSVLCSGNFYVPIDPALPEKRLSDMFAAIEPAAVLLSAPTDKALPFGGCPSFSLDELLWEPAGEDDWEKIMAASLDTDPLYCIFTSGSTGIPKGVLISHRSVIDMAEAFTAAFAFDDAACFGNQAPFDFDVSVKDLYIAMKNGGTVEILENDLFRMPKRLIERLNERRVNTVIWAVAAMKILSALKTFDRCVPECLTRVMFSGEVLPCKVLADWQTHLPKAVFVNLYGPTEITCNCTYYIVDRQFSSEEALPIGRAFANSGVFLLDGDQEVRSVGQVGEVCVRGSCLALGYYNNPEKTAEAFCQNPLQGAYPERIYRTGDLARYLPDGLLQFVGRADTQIKHMGHRIELGELELAAGAMEEITAVCALHDAQREKILLVYSAPAPCDKELLSHLGKALPRYMLPNRVHYLAELPKNRTGKIDRALLRREYTEKEV